MSINFCNHRKQLAWTLGLPRIVRVHCNRSAWLHFSPILLNEHSQRVPDVFLTTYLDYIQRSCLISLIKRIFLFSLVSLPEGKQNELLFLMKEDRYECLYFFVKRLFQIKHTQKMHFELNISSIANFVHSRLEWKKKYRTRERRIHVLLIL